MNFQTTPFMPPLKVMLINPLIPESQLLLSKILSGIVFGKSQLIDLILLVYANEITSAQELAQEVIICGFSCFNSIRVTSDLPRLTDADIFCFMTNFANPNSFDFENMDSNEQFDNLYLIIKIAANFAKPVSVKESRDSPRKKSTEPVKEPRKPVIVADGLLVIGIMMIIAKNLPSEILFSCTPLRSIAKITLSDFLKVRCCEINNAYVWAANDLVFHTEIGVPYLKNDVVKKETMCDWDAMSPEMLEKLKMEHVNFNASWMKREFIDMAIEHFSNPKGTIIDHHAVSMRVGDFRLSLGFLMTFSFNMVAASSNNPYGCIFKTAEMSKTLRSIWLPRCIDRAAISNISVGVISNGSLGTIRGLPYVLPIIITENSWSVNQIYEETSHLRHELKRINDAAVEHHKKLVPYCKKFLKDNIINKAFIPVGSDSESDYTSQESEDDLI